MQCQECKDDFPDWLVQDMIVNRTRKKCCGVCALKNVRESIGHPTYMFKAPNAKRQTHLRRMQKDQGRESGQKLNHENHKRMGHA